MANKLPRSPYCPFLSFLFHKEEGFLMYMFPIGGDDGLPFQLALTRVSYDKKYNKEKLSWKTLKQFPCYICNSPLKFERFCLCMRNLHVKEPCLDHSRSYFVSSPLNNLSSCIENVKGKLVGGNTTGRLLRTRSSSARGKSVRTGKFIASVGYKNHAKTE